MEDADAKSNAGMGSHDVLILEQGLQCPICIDFLFAPLKLGCGHAFCRLCLLQAARLAPDGRRCPECRATIEIKDPVRHAVDEELVARLKEIVPVHVLAAREASEAKRLEAFLSREENQFPVFYMGGAASRPGELVRLHFFEPRYQILIRRAWEGNKRFLFARSKPRAGDTALMVEVEHAAFRPGGTADIQGHGVEIVMLTRTWVEDCTGGLYYAEIDSLATDVSRVLASRTSRGSGAAVDGNRAVNNLARHSFSEARTSEPSNGDALRCADVYIREMERALQDLELTPTGEVAMLVRQGLLRARSEIQSGNPDSAVWKLRLGFHAVRELTVSTPDDQRNQRLVETLVTGMREELELPVFVMAPQAFPGDAIQFRFFEPRYRVLAREVSSSRFRVFLMTGREPVAGGNATLTVLRRCQWRGDENAHVKGAGIDQVPLLSVRQDQGKGGLFYATCLVDRELAKQYSIFVEPSAVPSKGCCVVQ